MASHRRLALLVLGALSTALWAGSPPPTPEWQAFLNAKDTPTAKLVASIQKMKWWDACADYGKTVRANKDARRAEVLHAYLISERLLREADRGNIGDRSVAVGMSECGVMASLGIPTKLNITENASGQHSQFIYRDRGIYVYTTDTPKQPHGVVTSIQR